MTIDVFCQVIDFFGDAAVAFRLARAIKRARPGWLVRLFCDDLAVLAKLEPRLNAETSRQIVSGVVVGRAWNPTDGPADTAVASLSCVIPDAYIAPALTINLEYLTAEEWAESTHLKRSLTPDGRLKYFFMPGFVAGTGGLVSEIDAVASKKSLAARLDPRLDPDRPWATYYAYRTHRESVAAHPDTLFITPLVHNTALPDNAIAIRGLRSTDYDALVKICDYNLVRGEDSLSRAVLSGAPFLWQAYPQEEETRLVKVSAFCRLMAPFFSGLATANAYTTATLAYNRDGRFDSTEFAEATAFARLSQSVKNVGSQEILLVEFIERTYGGAA